MRGNRSKIISHFIVIDFTNTGNQAYFKDLKISCIRLIYHICMCAVILHHMYLRNKVQIKIFRLILRTKLYVRI